MFENLSKTYSDRTYKYTTMVRHKGTVIAFAMDNQRRIVYSVLDLAGDAQTSVDTTNAKSPFDNEAWAKSPTELIFPTEIAEVGFSVADQTMMPVVKKGATPAPNGTMDEIRVWRRVRSGRELRADLHQRLTGLEPGLTGYWRFDEGAGTKVFDQTATGANGTITDHGSRHGCGTHRNMAEGAARYAKLCQGFEWAGGRTRVYRLWKH